MMSKGIIPTRALARKFDRYVVQLAPVFGHADRVAPFAAYCKGLLLPGERKSVEPMAARIAPQHVRSQHQSMHHFVSTSTWSAQQLIDAVADAVLPEIIDERDPAVNAWIIDDTGIPKKGEHSVGVAHQYCGQLGKQANCQVAVTLSIANDEASLPIGHRLYLPESWANDARRREVAGVPKSTTFQTKLEIALELMRHAQKRGVSGATVLADAAYGNALDFRDGVRALNLDYALAVQSTTQVWRPGEQPLAPKRRTSQIGRPPSALRTSKRRHPISVLQLARELPASSYQTIRWREGTNHALRSRFAAVRVRVSNGHRPQSLLPPEEWLVIEWPQGQEHPVKFWLSTVDSNASLEALVAIIMKRWRIERDYQELKSELGLTHYEGRSWLGFHHHAALCIAAYGFLLLQREAFPPSAALRLPQPALPKSFKPRGSAVPRHTP